MTNLTIAQAEALQRLVSATGSVKLHPRTGAALVRLGLVRANRIFAHLPVHSYDITARGRIARRNYFRQMEG